MVLLLFSRPLALTLGLSACFLSAALAQNDVNDPTQISVPNERPSPPPTIKPLDWKNVPEIVGSHISAPRVGLYAGFTRLVFDLPKGTANLGNVKVVSDASGFSLEFMGVFAPPLSSRGTPTLADMTKARLRVQTDVSPELSSWTLSSGQYGTVATVKVPFEVRPNSGGFKLLVLPADAQSPNDRVVLDLGPAYANRTPVPLEQYWVAPFPVGTKIVLDPGHGGTDPGAIGAVLEKETNLKMGLLVRDLLIAAGAEVTMSRQDDRVFSKDKPTDLLARAMLGRAPQTLFVSLHVNAMPKQNYLRGYGVETWWYPNHPDSLRLAQTIEKAVLEQTGAFPRQVNSASLAVLRQSEIPASLVEIGFTSHPVDGENLKNDNYLERVALGVATGIRNFVGSSKVPDVLPTVVPSKLPAAPASPSLPVPDKLPGT